ncbi:primary-amine oxidase [Paraburkholderia unamae]|uniref:primary-amine oxidase n=1 Tax=Paraburkholderia unamae TaxID=219649 RepID=UPI001CC4E70B|nr:primary-amine oxidase [Paraburkholderia unamae]
MNTNPNAHPLDLLSIAEMQLACDIVKAAEQLDEYGRFPVTELMEPPKAEVVAYKPGDYYSRRAFVIAIDRTRNQTIEFVVDLREKKVESRKALALQSAPYGQPPVMIEDFMNAERIVKEDAAWREAIKKRGLSEDDLARVQVDPFSAGAFDRPNENGRRLVRCVSYYRESVTDNGYAHPIEGVVAVVDLLAQKVIELVDDGRIIPIPRTKHNYDTPSLGEPRSTVKPLSISQPEGPSFTIDGWQVSWQNWKFRVGFTPREGLVLHQITWDDGKSALRPIVYRASVTEMCVPYSDPTTNHYWKSAFDAGEYGLGKLANQLELGCDCLGTIRYFDIPSADDFGNGFVMKNAVCLHEEDYGTLWKHYEFRTGVFEMRRSRRLVISFFATVGNYDYGFYWYFYQDGTIQLECKLTGIIQTSAVADGDTYPWGGMVTENLGGPTHQHFFNARLHMMVDGEKNSVTEHEFVPRPMGPENPYGNVFDTTKRVLKTEQEAARNANGQTGRFWKVVNPNVKNRVGANPGYKLIINDSPLMLADPNSKVRQRGGFATRHVWVTPYDTTQRYASGDCPNQHAGGDGLPRYIEANRNVENEDIVLWHSFGHTHVCKPEDFPVMPVEYAGFMLKPNNFFYGNPAMDLPGGRDPHSVQDGAPAPEAQSCCHSKS